MSEQLFTWFEIVIVTASDDASEIGKRCVVLGTSQDDSGNWHYAVLPNGEQYTQMFSENQLKTTGLFAEKESIYPSWTARVSADGKLLSIDQDITENPSDT
jgi:hypothetical protein